MKTFIVSKVSFVFLRTLMKDQILITATEMFLNRGFKSVTMDDIAQEMAISKKTIYQHFGNKEAVVAVVTDMVFENICNTIDHICTQNMNPIEELYDIKRQVMAHLKDEKTSPWHQLQKYYPQIHGSLRKRQFTYMQDCVINNIKRGLEQELFRPNIDVDFVSRIYFIGITGIKDREMFPNSLFDPSQLMETFLEYHLRGIVTPKGRKILNRIIQSNRS